MHPGATPRDAVLLPKQDQPGTQAHPGNFTAEVLQESMADCKKSLNANIIHNLVLDRRHYVIMRPPKPNDMEEKAQIEKNYGTN